MSSRLADQCDALREARRPVGGVSTTRMVREAQMGAYRQGGTAAQAVHVMHSCGDVARSLSAQGLAKADRTAAERWQVSVVWSTALLSSCLWASRCTCLPEATKPDHIHVDVICASPLQIVSVSANTYSFLASTTTCTWAQAPTPPSHSPASSNLGASPGHPTYPNS
jgi:hypothetical protein